MSHTSANGQCLKDDTLVEEMGDEDFSKNFNQLKVLSKYLGTFDLVQELQLDFFLLKLLFIVTCFESTFFSWTWSSFKLWEDSDNVFKLGWGIWQLTENFDLSTDDLELSVGVTDSVLRFNRVAVLFFTGLVVVNFEAVIVTEISVGETKSAPPTRTSEGKDSGSNEDASVEAVANVDAEVEIEVGVSVDIDVEADANVHADAKVEADFEVKADEFEVEVNGDADVEVVDVNVDAKVDVDVDTDVDINVDANGGVVIDAEDATVAVVKVEAVNADEVEVDDNEGGDEDAEVEVELEDELLAGILNNGTDRDEDGGGKPLTQLAEQYCLPFP